MSMKNYDHLKSNDTIQDERRKAQAEAEAQAEAQRKATLEANAAVMRDILAKGAEAAEAKRLEAEKQSKLDAMRQQEAFRTEALAAFKAAGGSETEFNIEWPSIRSELLRRRTVEAMQPFGSDDPVSKFIARENQKNELLRQAKREADRASGASDKV